MSREALMAWAEDNPNATDDELRAKARELKRAQGTGFRNALLGGIEATMQGPSLGWSDEISAAAGALPRLVPGGVSFADQYRANVDAIRSNLSQFQESNPFLAPALEIGGGFAGGGLGAGRAMALESLQRLPPAARAMLGGASAGAVAGAGMAEGVAEVPQAAATGAAFGAAMSPVAALAGRGATMLGRAAQRLYQGLTETAPARAQRIAREMLDDVGMTEDQFRRRMAELGPEGVFADTNEATRRRLRAIAAEDPGLDVTVREAVLDPRAIAGGSRLIRDAQESMGVPADRFASSLREINENRSRQARAQYGPIYDTSITIDDDLDAILGRPSAKKGYALATRIAADEGVRLPRIYTDEAGNTVESVDLRTLDWAKQGIDAVVENHTDKLTGSIDKVGRGALSAKKALIDYIEENTDVGDAYREARSTYAGYSAMQTAMRRGNRIFNEDAEDIEEFVRGMGDAEREAFKLGAFNAVRDEIESAKVTGTAAARAKLSTPKYLRRLRHAFDTNEQFDAFKRSMSREIDFQSTRNVVEGGSPTARIQADIAGQAQDVGSDIAEALTQGPEGYAAIAQRAWQSGAPRDGYPQQVNRVLSEILTSGADVADVLYSPRAPVGRSVFDVPFNPYGAATAAIVSQFDPFFMQGMITGQ